MPKTDKNSLAYDQALLNSIIGKTFPVEDFEKEMRKVFRKKSREKLWWSNMPTRIWDGKNYHEVNYRCCPESHNARNLFCLVLDREAEPGKILVREGYLESL